MDQTEENMTRLSGMLTGAGGLNKTQSEVLIELFVEGKEHDVPNISSIVKKNTGHNIERARMYRILRDLEEYGAIDVHKPVGGTHIRRTYSTDPEKIKFFLKTAMDERERRLGSDKDAIGKDGHLIDDMYRTRRSKSEVHQSQKFMNVLNHGVALSKMREVLPGTKGAVVGSYANIRKLYNDGAFDFVPVKEYEVVVGGSVKNNHDEKDFSSVMEKARVVADTDLPSFITYSKEGEDRVFIFDKNDWNGTVYHTNDDTLAMPYNTLVKTVTSSYKK